MMPCDTVLVWGLLVRSLLLLAVRRYLRRIASFYVSNVSNRDALDVQTLVVHILTFAKFVSSLQHTHQSFMIRFL